MRNRFDEQLEKLNAELITMGALCEQAITIAINALLYGNDDDKVQFNKVHEILKISVCASCFSSSPWQAICAKSPLR